LPKVDGKHRGLQLEIVGASMKDLPQTENALVLRTDFSDDSTWESICAAIKEPVGEFRAYVDCISDPEYDGLTVDQLITLAPRYDDMTVEQLATLGRNDPVFVFIVDRIALSQPDHPILVVDLLDEPGLTFRVIPSELYGVENNLSIGNLTVREFADNADKTGIFRGFPESETE
jgi:hypothetical protein